MKKNIITGFAFCFTLALAIKACAQNSNTVTGKTGAPALEFICELVVTVGTPQKIGEINSGERRIIPITGGSFNGPNMNGTVLPGGADWQLIKSDGIAELDARYTLQTDDGTLIYIANKGIRVASKEVLERLVNGEKVAPDEYYFTTVPTFETAKGKYDWLMKSVFIAKALRNPDNVIITVWKVQ